MKVTIKDLLPGREYAVQFRSVRDSDNSLSEWSRRFLITTTGDNVGPSTPTNVTWIAEGDAYKAEWDNVTTNLAGDTVEVDRYEIRLEADNSGSPIYYGYSIPATSESRVTWEFTMAMNEAAFLFPKASIEFQVAAVSRTGIVGAFSTQLTAGMAPPAAPTGLTATQAPEAIILNWDAVAGVASYNIYVSRPTSSGPWTKVWTGDALSATVPSSYYNEDHYYVVRAVSNVGLESADSNMAGPVRPKDSFAWDLTPPNIPVITAATLQNNPDEFGFGAILNVSWTFNDADGDGNGFDIRYKRPANSVWDSVVVSKGQTSKSIDVLYAYADYEVQIRAKDTMANESAWSATTTATTPSVATPATITGFASQAGMDAIIYTWDSIANPDLQEYELTFSTSSTFASGNTTYRLKELTLTVPGLTVGTTYYARVRGKTKTGAVGAWTATNTTQTLLHGGNLVTDGNIYLPPSAWLITNGGGIRNNAWSSGTSGFKIDTDGIEINDAGSQIKVDALKTGNISTAVITLTSSGRIETAGYTGTPGSGGFRLNASGLQIPDGTLQANKLILTNGNVTADGTGFTEITGDIITTGAIKSNSTSTVNGTTYPKWQIDLDGDAQFNNAWILGNTIVGNASNDSTTMIRSYNSNWYIRGDGFAYFNNAQVTGTITANSGSLGNMTVTGVLTGGTLRGGVIETASGAGLSVAGVRINNDPSGYIIARNSVEQVFYVNSSGAFIQGQINATSGNIGGWTIASSQISGTTSSGKIVGGVIEGGIVRTAGPGNNRIVMSPVDDTSFGADVAIKFKNTSNSTRGRIYQTGANFQIESSDSLGLYGAIGVAVTSGTGTISLQGGLMGTIVYGSGGLEVSGGGALFRNGLSMSSGTVFQTNGSQISGGPNITGGPTLQNAVLQQDVKFSSGMATGAAGDGQALRVLNGSTYSVIRVTSSKKYKENIQDADIRVEDVYKLKPRKYIRKNSGKEEFGFIAEEAYDAGLRYWVSWDNDEIDGFNYESYVVALQAAIVSQHERITHLENVIESLQSLMTP